ncbi:MULTISPECIES: NAD-dependent epimerase/dehydratase family protein [unclassified Luteimonas]|uniref:NAD-dependent epimerase/dehydratase family protein n=1 Tax=unclassified Luteimonas TaxID=2629088 RepID=UPI00160343C4|nr:MULTISPECIES: NAD-dependent epimerase/dehydratase family protein [unclassified Luteimonas]MBB1472361.1 NAD-dependent epimerase/dehydratase family protein [Luteimonas sp. MC1782]MBB6598922.1 NAD-dependent epimerase/dehydratase family protein [Luteimonas sp. MC1825]QOC89066.1 NAD-dependent epimerase/dehydratase family protein [Luteimonas sp. MC1825]
MKVLLTGAGGFLGRCVAHSLLEAGVDDLRLHFRGAPPGNLLDALRRRHPDARIEASAANLLYACDLPALVNGVECIVHAAAGMRGSAADMFANTVVGTRNLLDAAAVEGVRRVVMVGSFSVYRTEGLARGAVHDESVPIEAVGIEKGAYAHAKTRQEHLLAEYRARFGFETVVLRPGVIYGPGGGAFSSRVGIRAMGLFFSLGRGAELPLTYVENCADAVARATLHGVDGRAYNVVDDDLPSCGQYLRGYQARVGRLRVLPVPYWLFLLGARCLVRYHRVSKGQLPAVFTPYVVRSMYRPLRHSNAALKALGWRQRVPTQAGLARTFQALSGTPP